ADRGPAASRADAADLRLTERRDPGCRHRLSRADRQASARVGADRGRCGRLRHQDGQGQPDLTLSWPSGLGATLGPMGDSLQGGPVRLAILLASIAGMVVLGVKTAGGSDASASHGTAHGQPGIIVAAPARGSIPAVVGQRLGALPHKRGAAPIATGGTIYLLGGTQRTAHGGRIPVGSVLRIDGPGERTRVAKLPTPVTGAAAAAVGDRLYAIGGRLANGSPTN